MSSPRPCGDPAAPEHPGAPDSVGTAVTDLRAAEPAPATTADPSSALAAARTLGTELPRPGTGRTGRLWRALAEIARIDLSVARIVEPHLDALAILDQAELSALAETDTTWGVWAAEASGKRLTAECSGNEWRLTGIKPWCSLAAHLDHAVVTAHTGGDRRRAFAVDLRRPGVTPGNAASWRPAGLADVPTVDVAFDAVPAVPVGADDWYLTRPGFAWGGIGVAACWYGGSAGVADVLWDDAVRRERSRQRGEGPGLDQVGLAALGAVDAHLHAAREALRAAAADVDAGRADGSAGAVLALRVRRVVARAAEAVVAEVSAATGPGPLTGDAEHVRRVASLQVWVRQEHAQRDAAALGRALLHGNLPDEGRQGEGLLDDHRADDGLSGDGLSGEGRLGGGVPDDGVPGAGRPGDGAGRRPW